MRNLLEVNTSVKCSWCDQLGFFIATSPSDKGGCRHCPLCGEGDFENRTIAQNQATDPTTWTKEQHLADQISRRSSSQGLAGLWYCEGCRIPFGNACCHGRHSRLDGVGNAHLIGRWKYQGEEHVGLPQFDSVEEWCQKADQVEVLEWRCPNQGRCCSRSEIPVSYNCRVGQGHPMY